ncbi:MAG TPA: dihydrolipoamide acetyltransferase family protein [Thermoanaerobaculia bacterium]|jgi:2-oxoglutarate dehydrogenase E2 component (dihydrolipoamide succinyltransferase)
MPTEVIMPQMGESIAEGTITKWLKKVGDPVKRDEPIFEISTDKVDAEIPSPVAGTLLEIKVPEGQTVAIKTVVGVIGEAGEKAAQPPAAAPAEAKAPEPTPAAPRAEAKPAAPAPPAPTPQADGTPAAPTGTAPAPATPPPAPAAAPPTPAAAPAPAAGTPPTPPSPPARAPEPPPAARAAEPAEAHRGGQVESIEERIRRKSSPLVRKIAQEHSIEIGEVEGTGIHNRVTKNDILSYLENRKVAASPARAAKPAEAPEMGRAEPSEAPAPRLAIPLTDRDEVVAMTKIRRITAENMILSKRTSAHVTTVFQIDYANVAKIRSKHRDAFLEKNGVKLTYLPFIFRSAIQALREFPQVNASIDGDNIVYHKDIHLGMAVALDWGLIVPVIKNADEKSILGLARASQDLAERARTKRLRPEEIQGGTFTVTNPGVFGSLFGTPIIPQPQVAILGVGAIEKRPVVVSDEQGQDALGIRTVGYLALSFDHRLIDGADADRFMASVKKTLEEGEFDLG